MRYVTIIIFSFINNFFFRIADTNLVMTIDPEDYMGKLYVPNLLQINAVVTVKETRQHWSGEDDFMMEQPNLDIEVSFI